MRKSLKNMHSEFRRDIVSGEWVLIVPSRSEKRFSDLTKKRNLRKIAPKSKCIFEDPFKSVDNDLVMQYPVEADKKNWQIVILENKYPAVREGGIIRFLDKDAFFEHLPGIGKHELLITRNHNKNFETSDIEIATQILQMFKNRIQMFQKSPEIKYVSIFHNWGAMSGASVFHPHYQILAIPVVPPDIRRNVDGAERYFRRHKKCVYCEMLNEEMKLGKRVIYENDAVIAITPFFSRYEFEIKIFSKQHASAICDSSSENLCEIAQALQIILYKVRKRLNDPDYNFFIHTAPIDEADCKYLHWHIEIRPHWNLPGGFEYSTGMEVNVIDPDFAASILK